MSYKEECIKAMELLAKDSRVIFLGQNICYEGSPAYETMQGIPDSRKIEMPVAEELQLGMSIGLSLEGHIPVSVYPRMDFLWRAADQLVNHLDKIEQMSVGRFKPKVIIRTMVGSTEPLYPGEQHCGNYVDALRSLLCNIEIVDLTRPFEIVPEYEIALKAPHSSIMVEYAERIRGE